jgi:hypothetical protein
MKIYEVEIDRETGEWLGEPVDMNESTTASDWNARIDSESYHYDTAEIDGETMAILCKYVDD